VRRQRLLRGIPEDVPQYLVVDGAANLTEYLPNDALNPFEQIFMATEAVSQIRSKENNFLEYGMALSALS